MNNTCTTHRSRVPRRSFGRVKWGVTTVEDERGPGLDFSLCFVCGSRPWGAAAFHLCLFILLLKLLHVRRFPPPSSRTYELRYIGAETREEGGSRCQRALAAEGDRGAKEIGQQEVAETASGCPKRWCRSKRRTGGTEDSLPCSWVEEGWLPSERERRSRPRSPGGQSLLPSAMFGEEQGTGDSLPAALDRRSHRRPPGGGGASGRPPKMSSTIAWHREWAAQLVEDRAAVCPGTGPRFFFPLSPLSSLSLLILLSPFLSPHLSLPPGTPRPPWRAPPGRGGRGGVERSLVGTPALRGVMGVCGEWGGAESRGNGARPVE